MIKIGIRHESKYPDEFRVALVPWDVEELIEKEGVEVLVESSKQRAFSDEEYLQAGAKIVDSLEEADCVVGVKEIPLPDLYPNKKYLIFSHTIKGQKHNMPLLEKIIETKSTLIDYEKITDEKGRRLIFFGNFAGLAGMLNTLWILGKRLKEEGIESPFLNLKQAHRYGTLEKAKEEVKKAGEIIKKNGLSLKINPLIIGIFGYGNVSKGAQEILDLLPVKEVTPQDVLKKDKSDWNNHFVYKVVFKEKDMVERVDGAPFQLQDYYQHPEKYQSKTKKYLPYLSVLVNCIYWESKYPKILTKSDVKELWGKGNWKIKVIGDISCDLEGAIECTLEETRINKPYYLYLPQEEKITFDFQQKGIPIMAVSNLPSELPRESSTFFSNILKGFIPHFLKADWNKDYQNLNLIPELKKAIIVYKGELTPDYLYLNEYLK